MIRERFEKLMRVHQQHQQPVRLSHKRIYILPTGYGWVFGLLVMVMLIGAVNYANNLVFMVTFLLAGIGLNAIVQTHGNLSGLGVSIKAPNDRFAQQDGHAQVTLYGNGRDRYGVSLSFDDSGALVDLLAEDQASGNVNLQARRRGVDGLPRLKLQTRYPLGLFRAWSYVQAEDKAWVYPEPKALLPFPAQQSIGEEDDTDTSGGSNKGPTIDGVRDYYPGDSIRRIDWRALARGRGLLSKTGDDLGGGEQELWLEWQATGNLELEDRLSVLTAWLLEAKRMGVDAGLRMPGGEFPPAQDDGQLQNKLRYLAAYG